MPHFPKLRRGHQRQRAAAEQARQEAMESLQESLERLEHLTMVSVTVGFALLTVGLITGYVRFRPNQLPVVKLALATLAWVVYAVVLHAPFNPRFRGRRAALLSVLGFALMVGTIIVVLLVPSAGGQG